MQVVIHGPGLADSSEGSYRVHAADSPDNDREALTNYSKCPETVEAESREAIVDRLYDPEAYDREPGDLAMYLADVFFGPSCEELPLTAESTNEGEDSMAAVEYTKEQLGMYLETFTRTQSFRKTAKELGVSPATAKKLVEKAQAELPAATPKAASTNSSRTRSTTPAVPVTEDETKMIECKHCSARLGKKVSHPATTKFWYVNKSTGALHVSPVRCKESEAIYRAERKAAKAAKAAPAPASTEVPAAEAPDAPETAKPNLTVVAA